MVIAPGNEVKMIAVNPRKLTCDVVCPLGDRAVGISGFGACSLVFFSGI
jgi:hypothetical protein